MNVGPMSATGTPRLHDRLLDAPIWHRVHMETIFVPLVIVLIGILLTFESDVFLTHDNLINILSQMGFLAIVAFGQNMVVIGGGFDLSVGSQVALHGVVAALVMAETQSISLGILAALGSGLLFGLVNGTLVTGLKINPFIVTLGTLVVGRGIALTISNQGQTVLGLPPELMNFALGQPLGLPWLVWLMFGCFLIAAFLLHATKLSLTVFAIGGNREAARLAGVRVNQTTIATFAISGIFAAIAGIAVTAQVQSGQPGTGQLLELYSIAAIVLGGTSLFGGRGTMWGALFGVALITEIQNGLSILNVAAGTQQIVLGAVFILAASTEFLRRLTAMVARRRRLSAQRLQQAQDGGSAESSTSATGVAATPVETDQGGTQ